MSEASVASDWKTALIEEAVQRITSDLAMISDREVELTSLECEIVHERPVGHDAIHISCKFGILTLSETHHGCLLMPLSEAISLASYLLMMEDQQVGERREELDLDNATKSAMLEVANFVASAVGESFSALGLGPVRAYSEGCQGVGPGVRPALEYVEGAPLLVGRCRPAIHDFGEFEMVLMLPDADYSV